MEYEVQKHLHYGGIPSFNAYPVTRELKNVDIAVMGVPFDSGVTNRPGARLGPRAIRNMSQLACCFSYPWNYKISEKANIIDYGDVGYYVGPKTTEVMLEETHDHAKKILDAGCKLLTLGGDHTIPYGMVRAASENMADSRFCILIHTRTVRQVPMEMCPMLILHTICRRRAVLIQTIPPRYLSERK